MKIGVLSDSHIPASTRRLPEQVFHAFNGVDLILHAGDIYTAAALDDLESLAPVLAVGESIDLAIGQPRVEVKRVLELEGVRIGMVHRLYLPGVAGEVFPGTLTPHVARAIESLFGTPVDACIFGDTHYEVLERHGGVLVLNPGSPTLPRQMMRLGTVGLIEVRDGNVTAHLVSLAGLPGPPPVYV